MRILSVVALVTTLVPGVELRGTVLMEDVDSFWVEGAHVRLNGVDGPEKWGDEERAGSEAVKFLYGLTRGVEIVCRGDGEMTRGRFVVRCALPDGADLGEAIVLEGYGLDCARYSGGRYRAAEAEARQERRGLWGLGLMPEKRKPYC